MFVKCFKTGAAFLIVSLFTVGAMNAANDEKDKERNDITGNGPATPLVTWDGKDLTVESSEMIDRVVVSGERHEVADTVAVIALNPNRGIVDVTVETETGEYNCEVDTDAEGSTPDGEN